MQKCAKFTTINFPIVSSLQCSVGNGDGTKLAVNFTIPNKMQKRHNEQYNTRR